jgi:hypothetical protein
VIRPLAVVLLAFTVAGCEEQKASEPSMDEVVTSIEGVGEVTEVVRLTEDDDPNDLIGRPNGYDHAAVFYDSRLPRCDAPGIDCGAFLEVWDDAEEAKSRSQYILALQEGAPMLGSEFHYLDGHFLLRVNGELKPSEAEEYEQALADS